MKEKMKVLAIIPARGGSKRIPRKNIRTFMGKEIIFYPISTALKSGIFDDVIVSTDDEKIKQISEGFGASVPFLRSDKNSNEFATTFDVVKEVTNRLKEDYTYICCLYPTSVFVEAKNLIDAKKDLINKKKLIKYLKKMNFQKI